MKELTVTVTGAAGQIGYALLFRLASGAVFGPDMRINLQLLEIEPGMAALEGVVMELEDCAFPLLNRVVATSDLATAMTGANWVVLVGSVPRKAGMERSDLLEINGGIFTAQGRAINDHAADDVRVLVVGNPCNTNCLIAMNNAPDVPHDRFYAMTMLDENRAKAQLAQKAGVPVADVTQMIIWGNHSATQYPDFYHAKINGKLATDVITDQAWLSEAFIPTVQQRGAAIIKARGASSAASAANGIVDGLRAVTFDTPEDDYYSMCCYSPGAYGVDEGLIYSFPCRTQGGQLRIIEGIQHNDFAQEKLAATLAELQHERDVVKSLGLI